MDRYKIENAKFEYGDVLEISGNAPKRFYLFGRVGEVCGVGIVHSEVQMELFGQPIGAVLYLLEFSDGSSLEIPEPYLSKANDVKIRI